jgi:hypothetical protein
MKVNEKYHHNLFNLMHFSNEWVQVHYCQNFVLKKEVYFLHNLLELTNYLY